MLVLRTKAELKAQAERLRLVREQQRAAEDEVRHRLEAELARSEKGRAAERERAAEPIAALQAEVAALAPSAPSWRPSPGAVTRASRNCPHPRPAPFAQRIRHAVT